MTEELVEKVASAIDATPHGDWDPARYARAALASIQEDYAIVPREPTEAMKMAGAEAITEDHMRKMANYDASCDCWPAMISAAERTSHE